jgi:hypothetical protein
MHNAGGELRLLGILRSSPLKNSPKFVSYESCELLRPNGLRSRLALGCTERHYMLRWTIPIGKALPVVG